MARLLLAGGKGRRGRRGNGLPPAIVFEAQMVAAGIPAYVKELPFAHPRRYRFDYSWPERKLAVEIEGGTWVQGRHSRGAGMRSDCEKYNLAIFLSWRVLRFTSDMVADETAIAFLCEMIAVTGGSDV